MPFSHLELRAVILVFTARCKLTGTSPKHSSNHHSTSLNGSHQRAVPRWIAHHRSLTNPFRMYKQLVLSKELQRHQGKARPLGDQQLLPHCSPGANTNDKCERGRRQIKQASSAATEKARGSSVSFLRCRANAALIVYK